MSHVWRGSIWCTPRVIQNAMIVNEVNQIWSQILLDTLIEHTSEEPHTTSHFADCLSTEDIQVRTCRPQRKTTESAIAANVLNKNVTHRIRNTATYLSDVSSFSSLVFNLHSGLHVPTVSEVSSITISSNSSYLSTVDGGHLLHCQGEV